MPAFLEKTGRFALWDPAQPKQGLPLLLDTCFEKACGAPIAEKRFKRSKPQNELEMADNFKPLERRYTGHPHFHIFESLPGLNI